MFDNHVNILFFRFTILDTEPSKILTIIEAFCLTPWGRGYCSKKN